jgi:hypothetical protein
MIVLFFKLDKIKTAKAVPISTYLQNQVKNADCQQLKEVPM